jgi:hypothetical protein
LTGITYRLGRTLHFDAQAEKFVGDPDADQTADPALPRTVCDAGTLMKKGTFSTTCGILA